MYIREVNNSLLIDNKLLLLLPNGANFAPDDDEHSPSINDI